MPSLLVAHPDPRPRRLQPRPAYPARPTPSGDPSSNSVGRHTVPSAGRPAAAAYAASTPRTATAPAAPAAAGSSGPRPGHRDAQTTGGIPSGASFSRWKSRSRHQPPRSLRTHASRSFRSAGRLVAYSRHPCHARRRRDRLRQASHRRHLPARHALSGRLGIRHTSAFSRPVTPNCSQTFRAKACGKATASRNRRRPRPRGGVSPRAAASAGTRFCSRVRACPSAKSRERTTGTRSAQSGPSASPSAWTRRDNS